MMASDQDSKSCLKVAKLNRMNMKENLKISARILKQEGDINYKVPNTETHELPSNFGRAGCTVLHFTCRGFYGENTKFFNQLLDHGADITSTNSKGQTVLHEFIHNILSGEYHRLLQNTRLSEDPHVKASLTAHLRFQITANPVDLNGLSHFHAACITNNAEAIEFFLNNGVPIQQCVNADSPIFAGYTPLHFAARFVCLDAVKSLLHRGAKIDAQDAKKMTPLHVIISNILSHGEKDPFSLDECFGVVGEITENDNNINAQDHLGLSYLHVLCTFKDSSMLEQNLQGIEDVNRAVNADSPICPGFTPLHFAALFNLGSLKLLVAKGGDITIENADRKTPLDLCIARYDIEDIHDILARSALKDVVLSNEKIKLTDVIYSMRSLSHFQTFLRELGDANAHIPVGSILWPGHTPLHLAVILQDRRDEEQRKMLVQITKECLKNGFNISDEGVLNQTPLQFAFRRGRVEAVHLMLKYDRGTSNPIDKDGLSHLHIACAAGNCDVAWTLLRHGVDVNCKLGATFAWHSGYNCDQRFFFCGGSTPLHVAAAVGHSLLVSSLLNSGADLQAQDVNGLTAVHRLITFSYHSRNIVDVLLSSENLRECVADSCGLSHLHVACLLGHPTGVKRLLNENKKKLKKRLLGPGTQVNRVINCKATGEHRAGACQYETRDDRYGDPSLDPLFALLPFDGFTPLHFAIRHQKNSQTVKLLLQHGADMLAQSFAGSVPLYSAMSDDRDCYGRHYWRNFVATLKRDEDLRRRVEQVSGSTDLHLACYGRELPWIRKLLVDGANVNARIRDDSPFWPGHTPLHVLMKDTISGGDDADTIVRLLLSHGADVTISDGQFTPLHLVKTPHRQRHDKSVDYKSSPAISMIHSIQDFSYNPTIHEGLSHFHIACQYHEVDAVEGFLNHGVDVNAKIDYFSCFSYYSGCTPLHMTLIFEGDLPSKVKIVELLLKHGADVRAEDVFGDTPLHYAAKNCAGDQVIRMIFDAGADINAQNVNGASPLEMLKRRSIEIETVKYLIERGYRINGFSSVTDEGLIPIIFDRLSRNEDFTQLILSLPNINELDEMGRSSFHNIVSYISPERYIQWEEVYHFIERLIHKFTKLGCDVNHQDKSGRTALHTAVQFLNDRVTPALLAAGADINIADWEGKTAFAIALEPYDENKQHYRSGYSDAINVFTSHVHNLELTGVHVSALIKHSQEIALKKYSWVESRMNKEHFPTVLDNVEKVKVGSRLLSLRDVISETGDLRKYSKMTWVDRDIVVKYFESILNTSKDLKLGTFRDVVKLQHRNLLSRPKLVESAKLALDILVNIPLPDPCSRAILAHFENWELRNVIEAAN